MRTLRIKLHAALERLVGPLDRSLELFLTSRRILENLSFLAEQFPFLYTLMSFLIPGIVIGVAVVITFHQLIELHSAPITIGLNQLPAPVPASKQRITKPQKRTSSEVVYFAMLFATAKISSPGDRYLCSIWPGIKLNIPVGNALQTFAGICASRDLNATYIFNFTAAEFMKLTTEDLYKLSRYYAFAEKRIVIHDDQTNSRYGVSLRTRFNIVLVPEQQIAFTHTRDHKGVFTTAVRHDGEAFYDHQGFVAGLELLSFSLDEGITRCKRQRVADCLTPCGFLPLPEPVSHP